MENRKNKRPSNQEIISALGRLADLLKTDKSVNENPPHLSHWRELPSDVTSAYQLLQEGAQLVHGTATKYTLVGKIDAEEQKKLGADLLSGCEVIGAATHVLLQDASGCSRAVRRSAQRAALAVILNVIQLASAFFDGSALKHNIGAQKTGAVWESCDKILNKLVPQGNRNAIRRDLFTWTRETNDSMDEFQEKIDVGPSSRNIDTAVEEEVEDLFGGDDNYSEEEIPIATACIGILKCSRGTMKLTLETCDVLGKKFVETSDQKYLDWIAKLYLMAREVGEGVTDVGSLMYPPLVPEVDDLKENAVSQSKAIATLVDFVCEMEAMPSSVSELSHVLKVGIETRQKEFVDAIEAASK